MNSQSIQGATRLVALLGDPVAHSISPQIHNHAFSVSGLPFAYVPLAVGAADLHRVLWALRACGFAGANVTIPHKRRVVPFCDRLSGISLQTQTVNTLYFDREMLCGTTTDPEGFLRALAWMGHDCTGGHCVIIGNGGTARTLAFALALKRLPATLTLAGRSESKVAALAGEISMRTGCTVGWTTLESPALEGIMKNATLCVNCTSVGMYPNGGISPLPPGVFHANLTVFDVVYNPVTTLLLEQAADAGCAVQNGLRMLLYQGLASLKLWTGIDIPEDIFDIRELQGQVTQWQEKPPS